MRIFLKYFYQITMSLIFIFIAENSYGALNGPTWETAIRPGADTSRTSSLDGSAVDNDAFERPTGIAFSNDGKKVFVTNKRVIFQNNKQQECLRTFNLSIPYDIRSAGLVLDEIDPLITLLSKDNNSGDSRCEDINFSNDGRKLFLTNQNSRIFQFNLTAPYHLPGLSYEADSETSLGIHYQNFSFNNDGTKLFTLNAAGNGQTVKEYSLSPAYDVTSLNLLNTFDMTSLIDNTSSSTDSAQAIEFSSDGTAMFILLNANHNGNDHPDDIFQFQLSVAFDTSTASVLGGYDIVYGSDKSGTTGEAMGMAFDSHGSRLYIVSRFNSGPTDEISIGGSPNDIMHQYSLECSYGLVGCVDDSVSNIGSQLQLAKQNVTLNTSVIFKRFEWIKRNRESENLNSFNFNINYNNRLFESLANNLKN